MPRDLLLVSFAALALSTSSASGEHHWPQFRGPRASGIGSGHPPTHWDVTTGEHVAWKTAIAGLGHSAPIVWGDRVYLTTAVNAEAEHPEVATGWSGGSGESAVDTGSWTWQVWCLHLNTGRVLWKRDAHSGKPQIQRHLKAYTRQLHSRYQWQIHRRLLWFRRPVLLRQGRSARLGNAIWENSTRVRTTLSNWNGDLPARRSSMKIRVIVQCDCLNVHFVAVLDLRTGKEILRIPRPGEVATWSTPTVISTGKRRQIVCNGIPQHGRL